MRSFPKPQISVTAPCLLLTLVVAGCASSVGPAPVEHRDIALPARPVVISQPAYALAPPQPAQGQGLTQPDASAPGGSNRPTLVAGVTEESAATQPTVATAPIRSGSVTARALEPEKPAPVGAASEPLASDRPPQINRQVVTGAAQPRGGPAPVAAAEQEAGAVSSSTKTESNVPQRRVVQSSDPNSPDKSAAIKRAQPATVKPKTAQPKVAQPKVVRPETAQAKPAQSKAAQSTGAQPKLAQGKQADPKRAPSKAGARAAEPVRLASRTPFIWPANGALVQSFTDAKSMGIGISGRAGDPISAAADGKVIFSGLGPRGYGKLLIVKHTGDLLSVYAHNKNLLVKEGQAVRQGQKIAELGSTGTDRPKLHFEIRRQGKPVDPMGFLPRQ